MKDRRFLIRLKKEYPETYKEFIRSILIQDDGLKYENLNDEAKKKLKEIALSMGYRIDDDIQNEED